MREVRCYMQKIVGSILVIAASTGIGLFKGNEMALRVRQMREVKRIFLSLQQEIAYTMVPLAQAFERVADRSAGIFQMWFLEIGRELGKMEGKSVEMIWEECTCVYLKQTLLTAADKQILACQGSYMGQLEVNMQTSAIRLFLEQWEERISDATAQLANKKRMARSMGILGGVFLVILLL